MHFKLDFKKREREHCSDTWSCDICALCVCAVKWRNESVRRCARYSNRAEEIDRQTERVTQFLSLMLFVVVNRTFLTLIDHEN